MGKKGKKGRKKKAKLLQEYSAWLTHCPPGWTWRYGPLLVHVEEWSDDNTVVDWPGPNIYGAGLWPHDAMDDFVVTLQEVYEIQVEMLAEGKKLSDRMLRDMATIADVFIIPAVSPLHERNERAEGGASSDRGAGEGLGHGEGEREGASQADGAGGVQDVLP